MFIQLISECDTDENEQVNFGLCSPVRALKDAL